MKMNKKGFTLIEMLVVIAIIAILVAIVIPVVGSSTAKAQAATDAANLRSAKAALQIAVLNAGAPDKDVTGSTDYAAWVGEGMTGPVSKTDANDTFKFDIDTNGNVTVYFEDNTEAKTKQDIAHFSTIAGGSTAIEDEKKDS